MTPATPIVFVVDDDLSVRESLESLIIYAGWQPETFLSADEFLARVVQHELDHLDGVLVLDRVEPDVRRQALRELRTRDWWAVASETGHRL